MTPSNTQGDTPLMQPDGGLDKILVDLYLGDGSYEAIPNQMSNPKLAKAKAAIQQALERERLATAKAYGGCANCYGKGYATTSDLWSGYDTDEDIGSPGGGVSGGKPIVMKFCTCERGQQLKKWVAQLKAGEE